MMENIQTETYSLLSDMFIKDKKKQNEIYNAVETMPIVGTKATWAKMWCNSQHASFSRHLIAFAVVEGIFFSSSFRGMFWFKQHGVLPGLCFANELISHDDAHYCDFACVLYNRLLKPPCSICIREIVDCAIQIKEHFIREALLFDLMSMNEARMNKYIRFCAERLLHELKQPTICNVVNPFPWMDTISIQDKSNFFEK
jgi:ribonucleotide reductase beta subunit family protein with ferritin-like domain